MSNNESIFSEFEVKPENKKIWKLIPYFCFIFILIFSIDYIVVFPRTLQDFFLDWTLYFSILSFPASGIILLLLKHNYAWFVNTFYYMLSAMFLIIDFYIETVIDKHKLNEYRSLAGVALLAISLIILVLLQSRAGREYFKISFLIFKIALSCFVVVCIIILTSIYNS